MLPLRDRVDLGAMAIKELLIIMDNDLLSFFILFLFSFFFCFWYIYGDFLSARIFIFVVTLANKI